jgi:hypothetical protein
LLGARIRSVAIENRELELSGRHEMFPVITDQVVGISSRRAKDDAVVVLVVRECRDVVRWKRRRCSNTDGLHLASKPLRVTLAQLQIESAPDLTNLPLILIEQSCRAVVLVWMMRRRLSALAIAASAGATAGMALGGCAGGSTVSSVVDPVAQAAQVSELTPGFRATLSEELTPAGSSETVTASGTGIFDQRHQRGTMSFQIHTEGHSYIAESQFSDLALYMRLPSFQGSSVAHGKPWVKFDLRGAQAALGINSSAFSGPGTSSNPSQLLSYLKATGGQATRIGTEQVRGVSTTRYRTTIDYDRYVSTVPPSLRSVARKGIAALERLTGIHNQTVDVWIDGRHRIRREELRFHECLPGAPGPTQIHLKIEYFDFATQAMPGVPPSGEVADLTSYVDQRLEHIRLGCP